MNLYERVAKSANAFVNVSVSVSVAPATIWDGIASAREQNDVDVDAIARLTIVDTLLWSGRPSVVPLVRA